MNNTKKNVFFLIKISFFYFLSTQSINIHRSEDGFNHYLVRFPNFEVSLIRNLRINFFEKFKSLFIILFHSSQTIKIIIRELNKLGEIFTSNFSDVFQYLEFVFLEKIVKNRIFQVINIVIEPLSLDIRSKSRLLRDQKIITNFIVINGGI